MRAFASLAVALIVAVSVAQAEIPSSPYGKYQNGQKCPSKYFNDDCNSCICNSDGYSASCTKMMCIGPMKPQLRAAQEQVYAPNYKRGDKCPAKSFHDGCNACVCADDGVTAFCTDKACINLRDAKPEVVFVDKLYGHKKCPGKFFTDGCNTCVCSEDGVNAACSLMECLNRRRRSVDTVHVVEQANNGVHVVDNNLPVVYGYVQGTRCPAKYFIDDCNRCQCGLDGYSAACTRMNCGPRPQPRS